jgi:hypothetical protein
MYILVMYVLECSGAMFACMLKLCLYYASHKLKKKNYDSGERYCSVFSLNCSKLD